MSVASRGDLIQALVSLGVTLLLMGAVLFWSAGTLQWQHGWQFIAVFLLLTLVAMALLWRINPEIFAARRRLTGEGTRGWDIVLLCILLGGFLAILVVAGLDGGRFHWAPAPPWAIVLGYVLLLIGYSGTGWAQAVNRHFEPSVRIQSNRDHHVITTGPYAYIRHPGIPATSSAPCWRPELRLRSARCRPSGLWRWLPWCW
ncbi:isoprenylcysteine carboxylmethyltransferase family protein [Pararhizobium polonicum]|uniref:isoprenylcysteine carboxylmethyltransferase family protein n=1 Tax=Pararhizobium polonicum TaxID=1612624 RepID=UPI000AF08B90